MFHMVCEQKRSLQKFYIKIIKFLNFQIDKS